MATGSPGRRSANFLQCGDIIHGIFNREELSMRMPPARPTILHPPGERITLPKPVLLVDTREQVGYAFTPFRRWFSAIERRTLRVGDYTIAGLEDRMAVERKSVEDLFAGCSPLGSRSAFVRACARLGKLEFAALVIEGSLEDILDGTEWSGMHPNAVLGTLQALAVRWGIQPWFVGTPTLGEEVTACLLHKAYQLATLKSMRLPRRFVAGDV
jgi:DNA excision repair protein ERCC-4